MNVLAIQSASQSQAFGGKRVKGNSVSKELKATLNSAVQGVNAQYSVGVRGVNSHNVPISLIDLYYSGEKTGPTIVAKRGAEQSKLMAKANADNSARTWFAQ